MKCNSLVSRARVDVNKQQPTSFYLIVDVETDCLQKKYTVI